MENKHCLNELNNCTFVKTILMAMVVMGHSCAFWTENWFTCIVPAKISAGLMWFSQWTGSFHIYAFVLVSGYIFYHIKVETGGYQSFLLFIKNKAKRLLLPYMIVAVIWVIPVSIYFFKNSFKSIVSAYLLGIGPSQLWFLLMLFIVFMIFWPLSEFFRKSNIVTGIIVVGVFFGVAYIGRHIVPNIFQLWTACRYMTLFWIGFKIRQQGSRIIRKIPATAWLGIQIIFFISDQRAADFDGGIIVKLLQRILGFPSNIIGAIMAFVILQKAANYLAWENNKPFRFLCKSSMLIYLIHQQWIYFLVYWLNGVINPYIHAGINFIGSMAISLIIAGIFSRFKIIGKLIGGDKNG